MVKVTMRRRLSKTRFALLVTLALLLVGIPVQIGIQLWRDAHVPGMALTRAIAYRDSPYFGPDFLREQAEASQALTSDETAGRFLGDYHGKYFNIVDGWRVVTDTPERWDHTVWLFGNSTMRDSQVPDWLTKASYLQRLFNRAGYRYRVLNRSDNGVLIAAELFWLKSSPIQPGDIVVFYGSAGEPTFDAVLAMTADAQRFARAHGADFVNFISPNIWSMPLSPDEQLLEANRALVPAQVDYPGKPTSADYQRFYQGLALAGIRSHNLGHALDPIRAQGVNVYYDHVHTVERGNEAIARAIYDALTVF